jgi:protein phosphatase
VTELRAGGATDVGQVRSNNQDSFLILAASDLFGVADGMGGHNGGEVASRLAVESLEEHAGEASLENLMEAARIGNRTIFERAGADPELHGMGTTLCALRVVPSAEGDELAWINVGDSRVYLFRDGALIQLSRDHSLVEDLVRDGQLTEDEAKVHPKRNIITRALGIDVDVDVDGSTVLPYTGDRFLLASDGLFGEISDDQIAAVLRRLADPTEAAEELVRLANEAGGRDNITVIIVDVVDDGGRALMASALLASQASGLESRDPGDEPVTQEAADGDGGDGYTPVFADRRSSLPESTGDYGPATDDPFSGMDEAGSKRFTWRVVAFVLALLLVVAVVVGALMWSGRNTYFVQFDDDVVVLYQGKPGGLLWMDPEVAEVTTIERDDLPADVEEAVEDRKQFGDVASALRYLSNLEVIVEQSTTTTEATTTTSTTTTTEPRTTTTAAPVAPTTTPPAPTTVP